MLCFPSSHISPLSRTPTICVPPSSFISQCVASLLIQHAPFAFRRQCTSRSHVLHRCFYSLHRNASFVLCHSFFFLFLPPLSSILCMFLINLNCQQWTVTVTTSTSSAITSPLQEGLSQTLSSHSVWCQGTPSCTGECCKSSIQLIIFLSWLFLHFIFLFAILLLFSVLFFFMCC